MENKKNISLFEDYLNKEMSQEEIGAFENRLQSEPEFKKDFEDHKVFITQIKEGTEYSQTLNKLDQIHDELYSKKSRPLILRPSFYIPISIAASITLLVMIAFPPFGGSGDSTAMDEGSYEELENAEDNVAAEEAYLEETSELDSASFEPYLKKINKQPKGTAFLIDQDGYFLTVKHLVKDTDVVVLQHKDLDMTFETKVVYRDPDMDLAILKCEDYIATEFDRVPFKFFRGNCCDLGEDVFTLGYQKKEIVFNEGVVSSKHGYKSDTLYFEVSMPANPGYSGAPVFTMDGRLLGIITANNSKKQSVTYVLKHNYLQEKLKELDESDSVNVDMNSNYARNFKTKKKMIKRYTPFIFEVH